MGIVPTDQQADGAPSINAITSVGNAIINPLLEFVCRVLLIPAEDRLLVVPTEDRLVVVPSEDRKVLVPVENRTLNIPCEGKRV